MAKKTKTEEVEFKKTKIVHVPLEMPTIYVNHAQISFSLFDATIIIGELQSANEETQTMNIHPRAKLVMSHGFLIEFAKLINKNLELFAKDADLNALPDRETEFLEVVNNK